MGAEETERREGCKPRPSAPQERPTCRGESASGAEHDSHLTNSPLKKVEGALRQAPFDKLRASAKVL
jgi:hypothetical protein